MTIFKTLIHNVWVGDLTEVPRSQEAYLIYPKKEGDQAATEGAALPSLLSPPVHKPWVEKSPVHSQCLQFSKMRDNSTKATGVGPKTVRN